MGSRSAVIRATVLEVLSEPLSLLLTLSALVLAIIGPVLHCHNFGLPARMACEAGLSAQMIGGIALGIFAAVRAIRREEESGTLAMALAHPISRGSFFLSKCLGVSLGVSLLVGVIFCVTTTLVRGALIGADLAAVMGDVPRIWGPAVAEAVAIPLLGLLVGAAWNRFANGRFVFTSLRVMIILAVLSLGWPWEGRLWGSLLVSSAALLIPTLTFTLFAAAMACRFKDRGAIALAFGVLVVALPALGNYYPSTRVFRDGWAWGDILPLVGAALPLLAGSLLLGVHFMNRKDIG